MKSGETTRAVELMKSVRVRQILLVFVLSLSCTAALVHSASRGPGWGELSYEPPAAGTYQLPVIMSATNGVVLKDDHSTANLFDLMSDRIVFLSFIFTRCSDVNGCPLANAVLYKVQSRLNQRPELAKDVALLSISFDPEFDTPEIISALKKSFQRGVVDWEFLTTDNQSNLQPILDGYGQFAVRPHDEHGVHMDDYVHLLRVYLIDKKRHVRNIYSVSFLHPDILMNDLETLLLESQLE